MESALHAETSARDAGAERHPTRWRRVSPTYPHRHAGRHANRYPDDRHPRRRSAQHAGKASARPAMTQRNLWLRAGGFIVATLLVTLLGAWLLFGHGRSPIQTDLLAMLPATERNPLAEVAAQRLAHANGDRVILLVANADDEQAK